MNKRQRRNRIKTFKREADRVSKARYPRYSYIERRSPFAGVPDDQVLSNVADLGSRSDQLFHESLNQLKDFLSEFNPILLLAFLSFYHLSSSEGEDREFTEQNPLLLHHIELIQGLTLQSPLEDFGVKQFLDKHDFEAMRVLVQNLAYAFSLKQLKIINPSMSIQEYEREMVLDMARVYTVGVRNWSYYQQTIRIVQDIFKPLDDDIEKALGIRISSLIGMFDGIVSTSEGRLNQRLVSLRPMVQAKDLTSVVKNYLKICTGSSQDEENILLAMIEDMRISIEDAKSMLICHADLSLPEIYTYTLEDFLEVYPGDVDHDALRGILIDLSHRFGELSEFNPEYLFMDNPIWKKPLILVDEDLYFWPLLTLFQSFCQRIAQNIVSRSDDLLVKYQARRSDYLEGETARLFTESFPNATVLRGSKWQDPATCQWLENDILVSIDSHLIISEAKSGGITDPALRGAPDRLINTIEKLVLDPAKQASQFAKHLREYPGIHEFASTQGGTNRVDTTNISKIICWNVTLDPVSSLGANWKDLQRAGFIPSDSEYVPVSSLSDLEIIFEILDSPCEKLHYMLRRPEFELSSNYDGEELDLLALYIGTGLNIGEKGLDNTPLNMNLLSKTFDCAFA